MTITHVTDAEFEDKVLNAPGPVLVDFWAEWCGPCKAIAPALEEISQEMGAAVTIAKVDVDSNPSTPAKYGVRGIPTLIIFKGGQVSSMKVGALPKAKLAEWIQGAV
jgi:thioredoxin 1